MTRAQIKWAEQHDWCICGLTDSVIVLDVYIDRDGILCSEQKEFSDYRALRRWAGY